MNSPYLCFQRLKLSLFACLFISSVIFTEYSLADEKTATVNTKPLEADIFIETDIYFYALNILAGRHPIELTDYSGENSQRDVVEFIYIQQALKLGGLDIDFHFTHGNYDARNPKLLARGLLLISLDSIWLSEAKKIVEHVYISEPVIRRGEYWAGVYTSINNHSAKAIRSLDDLRRHSIVSSSAWHTDWVTLQHINPVKLIDESDWIGMAKMVSKGWVDVMLIPFTPTRPFTYSGKDYELVAIEGVKVMLDDSRHILVSRHHPLGKVTFEALERGLKILRQRGLITKAYNQSGFFNPLVKDWILLNSPEVMDNPKLFEDKPPAQIQP